PEVDIHVIDSSFHAGERDGLLECQLFAAEGFLAVAGEDGQEKAEQQEDVEAVFQSGTNLLTTKL
ncbi:MAG: hypothetical protein ACXVBZ_13265, partial [Flavisolibacter sp.]